jgi:hypothetical protein
MKCLIVGLGSMGQAHLRSLIGISIIKKIYLYDINKKKLLWIKKKYNNKIEILDSLKKKNNYHLAIIATNSLERYKTLKSLIRFNSVKNILLEKFPFSKINEFKMFQNKKNHFTDNKIDINTWGFYLAKSINLKIIPTDIIVKTNSKNFLSNFIHYADIFLYFNKKEKYSIDLSQLKKKIFNNTRKEYSEKRGKIFLNSKHLKLEYLYDHKLKNVFEIFFVNVNKIFFQIKLNNHMQLELINKNKNKNKNYVNFPNASILTKKYFYETLRYKHSKIFSSSRILKFCEFFLKKVNQMKIKNFYIT